MIYPVDSVIQPLNNPGLDALSKSVIYTPRRDHQHPRLFHMGSPRIVAITHGKTEETNVVIGQKLVKKIVGVWSFTKIKTVRRESSAIFRRHRRESVSFRAYPIRYRSYTTRG